VKREKYVDDVLAMIAQWQSVVASEPNSAEAKDWHRRLTRLAKEALKREIARDWDWFWWLDEFSRMRAETIYEDNRKYDTAIITGGKEKRRQANLRDASNAKRAQMMDADRANMAAGIAVHKSKRQLRRIKNKK
jgi:hypothetical protein